MLNICSFMLLSTSSKTVAILISFDKTTGAKATAFTFKKFNNMVSL